MKLHKFIVTTFFCLYPLLGFTNAEVMPKNFVYLKDIDPSILQDIRYATEHNFMGHPIIGYQASTCILTRKAAEQLKKIQTALKPLRYSLKVYDCYRPQQSVDAMIAWIKNPTQTTKSEFFPDISNQELRKIVHLGEKSEHSRGSTVDLTIVQLPVHRQESYHVNQFSAACYAPYNQRFHDNSIDMGTGFDCFISTISRPDNTNVSLQAYLNRMLLRYWMKKYGFMSVESEWWHFTLKNEPYRNIYFNFPVY